MSTSKAFVKLVQTKGRSVLDRIITMDESSVSMHTPVTKQQSKQWLKKGTPDPVKARVHAFRTKTMMLAFFDSQGMVYMNYVPRGSTVSAKYIIRALGTFLKNLRKKRPETAKGEWFLHWDIGPVHTAKVGGHHHDPGGVQEGVGGGPEGSQQGGVRAGLSGAKSVFASTETMSRNRKKSILF